MTMLAPARTAAQRPALGNVDCHKLDDGSYSWDQPAGRLRGYEGRCGQTAAANLLTMIGTKYTSPEAVIGAAGDMTPGSRPSTLLRAVSKLGPQRGINRSFRLTYDKSLSGISVTNPIVCMVQWDAVQLHWITVVKATRTEIKFNHWGTQVTWSRARFDKQWALKTAPMSGVLVHWLGWLYPNTALRAR